MVGLWSYNGPAIVQALKLEAKLGSVKMVCFDDERETLAALNEGAIFGTVAQQPFEYGYQAVKTAAQILRGDRSAIPNNKMIFVPTIVIQRNNVDDYIKKTGTSCSVNESALPRRPHILSIVCTLTIVAMIDWSI